MSRSSMNRNVGAGEMRHPVVVQRVTYVDDGVGGQMKRWDDYATIFCAIRPAGGNERYSDGQDGQVRTVQTWNFTTWWRDDILVTDRLLFRGALFNIRDAEGDNINNKLLSIRAESGVEQ